MVNGTDTYCLTAVNEAPNDDDTGKKQQNAALERHIHPMMNMPGGRVTLLLFILMITAMLAIKPGTLNTKPGSLQMRFVDIVLVLKTLSIM